jgi:hypothetical protein
MIGSTTPALVRPEEQSDWQSEEQSDWHPVHRANALLREALQSTTESFETLQAQYGIESLSNAIESAMEEVQITYPTPLATRFDNLDAEARTISCLEALVGPVREAPSDFGVDAAAGSALNRQDNGSAALPAEIVRDADAPQDFSDSERLESELALEPEVPLSARQLHMRSLMGEFRQRQRDVSLLVAASIAAAVLLTLGGVVLTVSLTGSTPIATGQLTSPRSTSAVWQKPAQGTTGSGLSLLVASADRAAKGEPLAEPPQPIAPQTILAANGRKIALGPLLPTSHARYLLIRGLPPESRLSTGQQSGTGTWMVKGDKAGDLTLSLRQAPSGDYPIEIYSLDTGVGPQARQSLVLRVALTNPTLASLSGKGPSD